MVDITRARADIVALANEAKTVIDGQVQGDPAQNSAILYLTGVVWGLTMAVQVLDGGSADQALTSMEDALAIVIGRLYLNGELPAPSSVGTLA